MISSLRRMVGLLLVALIAITAFAPNAALWAQTPDQSAVSLDGSALVGKIVDTGKTAYLAKKPDAKINLATTGTAGVFDKLCGGSLDVAMAYGAITDAADSACLAKSVKYVELLLGYNALVLVANTQSPASCLTADQFGTLLSAGEVKDWNKIDSAIASTPINAVYAPANNPDLPERYQLGVSLGSKTVRSDLQSLNTATEVADKVVAEANSIGLMTLADYNKQSGKSMKLIQIKDSTNATCIDPVNSANLDEGRYPLAGSLYLYVNVNSLSRQPVTDFLTYLLSSEGRGAVNSAGFSQASSTIYSRGTDYLASKRDGRTFSRLSRVNIPADTAGVVNISGSAEMNDLLTKLNSPFTPRFSRLTLNLTTISNEVAYRHICRDETDVIGVTRPIDEKAEAPECQKFGIETLSVPIGADAQVIVTNAQNKAPVCLTYNQVAKVFAAKPNAEKASTKWADIVTGAEDMDLIIVMPTEGNLDTDRLLTRVMPTEVAPIRRHNNVTENNDEQYRAAAVANVKGGITFMNYSAYLKSPVKDKLKLVSVDPTNTGAADKCVAPTDDTVGKGTYGLSNLYYLVFNTRSFARAEIRAYVWYLLSEDALSVLKDQGLIGTDAALFAQRRDFVLDRFNKLAATSGTLGTPAATAAPTTAATPEATAAATSAATPVATSAATEQSTPAATANATTPATPQATATPVATVNPTATPQATATATANATSAATPQPTPVATQAK